MKCWPYPWTTSVKPQRSRLIDQAAQACACCLACGAQNLVSHCVELYFRVVHIAAFGLPLSFAHAVRVCVALGTLPSNF